MPTGLEALNIRTRSAVPQTQRSCRPALAAKLARAPSFQPAAAYRFRLDLMGATYERR